MTLPTPTARSTQVPGSSRANLAFAIDLYRHLSSQEGNLIFSPISISFAVTMLLAGAAGKTARQMEQMLYVDEYQYSPRGYFSVIHSRLAAVHAERQITMSIANSLWPQDGIRIRPEFIDLCRTCYGVEITTVDYANDLQNALRQINASIEKSTDGRIKNCLQPSHIPPLMTLLVINAIYFKGNWAIPFDLERTESAPFFRPLSDPITVPLMRQTGRFGYLKAEGLQVLELPYVGGDLSMILLLPDDPAGLPAVESSLTADLLTHWTGSLCPKEVRLALPRFKIGSELDLSRALGAMGMRDAFSSEDADFSGLSDLRNVYVSKSVQRAYLEVNEEGSEAGAFAAMLMQTFSPSPAPVFRADHPFVFLIRETSTASILFLGRVVDPTTDE